MATANDLIKIAQKEIGVKESPANSNCVKYNTEYYGKKVVGLAFPWCAVFVWHCCKHSNVELPIKTASCTALMNAAKTKNMWFTSNFKPGDITIYDFTGNKKNPSHCGIIESVSTNKVIAIEGNTSISGSQSNGGMVCRKERKNAYIIGVVRPIFDDKDEIMNTDTINKMTDDELVLLANRIQTALGKKPVGSTLAPEYNEAIKLGLTNGTNPQAFCTRAQAAVMDLRNYKKNKE